MPALYGYARVSTTDQDLAIQEAALKAAGCTVIRAEKVSGTSLAGRTELETLLAFMRPGDTLVVTRVDRLARSLRDLQNLVHELRERGVHLRATEQPIDTSTAAGKAFLDMLGVFAEFETNLRRERQLEGIAAAKQRGVYKGGRRPSALTRCVGCGRAAWGPPRSPSGWGSGGRASTGSSSLDDRRTGSRRCWQRASTASSASTRYFWAIMSMASFAAGSVSSRAKPIASTARARQRAGRSISDGIVVLPHGVRAHNVEGRQGVPWTETQRARSRLCWRRASTGVAWRRS
jgi:hypothetical protein